MAGPGDFFTRPWDSQPQGNASPSELLRDASTWSAATPDRFGAFGATSIASANLGNGNLGRFYSYTRAGNAGALFGTRQLIPGLAMTVAVVAAPVASANRKAAFSQRTSGSNAAQWWAGFNSDSSIAASSGSISLVGRNTAATFGAVTATGGFDGGVHCWVMARGSVSGDGYVYKDGESLSLTSNTPTTGTIYVNTQIVRVGNIADYATDGAFVCDDPLYFVAVWPYAVAPALAQQVSSMLARSLGPAFEPRRIPVPVAAAGGGGSWSVSLIDSAAGVDIRTSAAGVAASIVEASAVVDIHTALAAWQASRLDANAAADAQAATAGSVTAAVEASAATDLRSAVLTAVSAITEAVTGADVRSATGVLGTAIAEGATSAETSLASTGAAVATVELSAATDLRSALLTAVSVITEASAASDIRAATAVLTRAISESAAATDTASSNTGATVTAVEAAAGADLRSALLALQSSLVEGATAADLVSALLVSAAAVFEAAATVDTSTTGAVFIGSATEAAVTADALTATALLVAQVVEAGSVTDQHTRAATLIALLTESVAGSDVPVGLLPASYTVSITELAAALDVLGGVVLGAVSLREVWAAWSRVTLVCAGVSAPCQAAAFDSHVATVVSLVSRIDLE